MCCLLMKHHIRNDIGDAASTRPVLMPTQVQLSKYNFGEIVLQNLASGRHPTKVEKYIHHRPATDFRILLATFKAHLFYPMQCIFNMAY